MNIAVNTRFLLKDRLEGIGWFTYQTLKRITANHPEHQFYFFFDRPYDETFVFSPNVHPIVLFPPARHPFLWYWWFEWSLPKALKKVQADIFLSTDGYLSLSSDIKSIIVIHDLAFEHFPNYINKMASRFYRHFTPKYAKKANQIITVSGYSKEDIIKKYDIEANKIAVVFNGSDDRYKPLSETEKETVKSNYTDGKDYFLFVGAIHPRKNTLRLLKAFEQFKQESMSDIKLIIAGREAWGNNEMKKYYDAMGYKQDVIFLNHCGLSILTKIMGAAYALTYPSLFEGFGIPILEAMHCDIPVITSNTSSMPEVIGDVGIIVDPISVEEIKNAMLKITADKSLRASMIEKGRIQRAKFNWDKSAEKMWEVIEKTF